MMLNISLRNMVKKIVLKRCLSNRINNSPLSGITVVDLTRIVAGPYCTMLMGDLGANIIKVEHPDGGDEARKWGPPFIHNTKESSYFSSLNRNKMSICVNISTAEGKDIIYDLAKKCDVLVENYIPGKLLKYGLGYEDLKAIAPHLIYCSITGYGPDGPYAHKPGYDVIAAGYGGLLSFTGEEAGGPVKAGVPMTDMATGLFAHASIMAALLLRQKTGIGQKIDCNLLGTQLASLINLGSNYINNGKVAVRRGTGHESIVPYQAFATADGYVIVGAGSNSQFQNLCELLNCPHISKEPKFSSNTQRVKHRKELINLLQNIFKQKSTKHWINTFEDATFPNGPVNTLDQVFADSHVKHLDMVKELEYPEGSSVKVIGPSVKFSLGGNYVRSRPPLLGEHTQTILMDYLKYDCDQIQKLRNLKVIS